jgi:ABC-type ATPase with predicted acetyltransferase domain
MEENKTVKIKIRKALNEDLNTLSKMIFDRNFDSFNIIEKLIVEFESSNHDIFIFSSELLSDLGYIDYVLFHQSTDFFFKLSEILSSISSLCAEKPSLLVFDEFQDIYAIPEALSVFRTHLP